MSFNVPGARTSSHAAGGAPRGRPAGMGAGTHAGNGHVEFRPEAGRRAAAIDAGIDTGIDTGAETLWRSRLARTVEGEIIPRLMLVHKSLAERRVQDPAEPPILGDDVEAFARLLVRDSDCAARSFVHGLRASGASLEKILLDLFSGAARQLGDYWTADIYDFAEVTLGLSRLQQLLHEFAPAFGNEVEHRDQDLPILLAPMPGEQHTLGILMVEEFFRRAGWDVWARIIGCREDLVDMVRGQRFLVCGLSISSDSMLDELAALIRDIKRDSLNRDIRIMVGGPVFTDRPHLSAQIGADATAADGRHAVSQAHNLVSLMPARC